MTRPTPLLHLEQQRFGERERIASDEGARAELDAHDAALLQRLTPQAMAARITDEIARSSLSPSSSLSSLLAAARERWLLPAVPVFAMALGLFVVTRDAPADGSADTAAVDDTRSKGLAPALQVYLADGTTPRALRSGDLVGAGDVLQVHMRSTDAAYGVVISIDGRGGVTRHFPDGDDTALPRGTAALPFSFELDDAPGFERFFLVTSARPIDVAVIEAAATAVTRAAQPVEAPLTLSSSSLTWSDVVLRKR
jgi:hypothetical protein